MSKLIASAAIKGAHSIVDKADKALADAIKAKGEAQAIAFPDTAYYLPVIYALTGIKVATLGDLLPVMGKIKELLPEVPTARVWLPYLGNTLDAGAATLMAEEIIEGLGDIGEGPSHPGKVVAAIRKDEGKDRGADHGRGRSLQPDGEKGPGNRADAAGAGNGNARGAGRIARRAAAVGRDY